MKNTMIRPISDLRTKLSEISKVIHESDEPIYFTKNGYGDMVLMSIESYSKMLDENEIYLKMREAEIYAEVNEKRLSSKEVFDEMHKYIDKL